MYKEYDYAIELDPKNEKVYISRGKSEYKLNNIKGAIRDYKMLIKLNPKNDYAINQLKILNLILKERENFIKNPNTYQANRSYENNSEREFNNNLNKEANANLKNKYIYDEKKHFI